MKTNDKRVNLMPEDLRPSRADQLDQALKFSAVALAALVVLLGASGAWRSHRLANDMAELTVANAALDTQLAALQPSSTMSERKARLLPLVNVLQKKILWADAFKELSGLVSAGTWIEGLQSVANSAAPEVVINGLSSSPAKVNDLVSDFEKSYYFRNTMLKFSQRKKDVSPLLYEFQLNTKLKSDENQVAGP